MLPWVMLVVAGSLVGADASWPGFLGVGHGPLTAGSLPLTWSNEEHLAWSAKLPGHGQSSPVVWGDRVFVTSVSGAEKQTYHLVCLVLSDGRVLWERTVSSSDPVKNTLYVSRAAPTPCVDADGVYVFFESGDFAAWTLEGEPRWQRSLSKDYGKFENEFGLAASPVLAGSRLLQLIDHGGPSYVIALDKGTGETIWKTARSSRRSWTSPVLVPVGDRDVLIASSDGSVDGYDPATGEQFFNFTDVGGNTGTTPFVFGEGRFLVSASAGQRGESAAISKKSNMAMELVVEEGKVVPKVMWRNAEVSPTFSSPIVHEGYAYWMNRQGVISCLDATTGELKYAQRTPQSAWATPLGVDDRLYLFGKDGVTTVLAAGPEYKVLAENVLWNAETAPKDESLINQETEPQRKNAAAMFASPVQYGVAAVPGSLLIRTGTVLYCVRK